MATFDKLQSYLATGTRTNSWEPESSRFHLEVVAILNLLEVQHRLEHPQMPFQLDIMITPDELNAANLEIDASEPSEASGEWVPKSVKAGATHCLFLMDTVSADHRADRGDALAKWIGILCGAAAEAEDQDAAAPWSWLLLPLMPGAPEEEAECGLRPQACNAAQQSALGIIRAHWVMGLGTQADRADESFPLCAGNQVYVGTAVGNLFQFGLPSHVDSEDKDLRAVQVGVVRLSTRRPVEQVCATERFVFTLLDGVLNVLPADIQSAPAVELCKDVKQICLHTGSSGEEVSGEICVATRKKLIIFANKGTNFEQRQEIPTSEAGVGRHVALQLTALGSRGSRAGSSPHSILKQLHVMRRVTIPASLEEDEKELVIDVEMGIANESGVCVWDSALCLGEMLIKEQLSCGERVLELGAGTGYVGLVAAALARNRRVTLTEPGQSAMDHADAIELDWGDAPAISGINTAASALVWHQSLICAGFRREYKLFSERTEIGRTWPDGTNGHTHVPVAQLRSTSHEREYFATMAANGKVADGKVADGKVANGKVANGKIVNGKVANGNVSVESSKGPWAECAACSAQGPRPQNEDVHVMLCSGLPEGPAPNIKAAGLPGLFDDLPELVSGPSLPEKVSDHSERCPECLFAVFDGHGGASAAKACAARFPTEIREELDAAGRDSAESRRVAVQGTYLALDRHLRIKLGPAARECGTTCVFAYAWKQEENPAKIGVLLANLGDSRALVLKSDGKGFEVAGETKDHTPNAPEEEKRIKAAGGKVEVFPGSRVPVLRVDGFLGCSRALGDFRFKEDAALLPEQQKVSAVPEVYEFECESGDAIVLACDGVFDVLSSSKVAMLVSAELSSSEAAEAAAKSIVKAALDDPRQQDNVTCVVALLK
eukprot:s2735_g8.t5